MLIADAPTKQRSGLDSRSVLLGNSLNRNLGFLLFAGRTDCQIQQSGREAASVCREHVAFPFLQGMKSLANWGRTLGSRRFIVGVRGVVDVAHRVN